MADQDRCIVCQSPDVEARGRCGTCVRYLRRHGHDRSWRMVDLRQERKDKQDHRDGHVTDEQAMTYGEWARANGYDAKSGTYKEHA